MWVLLWQLKDVMNSCVNKKPLTRTNIFLFAAHHVSGNIAAQRFKSLMRYLDASIYQIHVFTQLPDTEIRRDFGIDMPNMTVHVLDGQCVGRFTSPLVVFLVVLSSFFIKIPFAVGVLKKYVNFTSCWMINALMLANTICKSRLSRGEKCFVIGTYSPIDALIASRCLSAKFSLPYMQDFRDGFVFESSGRKGCAASWLKSVVEWQVVQSATLISSVSSALVDDFKKRYASVEVKLLPNGYDPAEFESVNSGRLSLEALAIVEGIPKAKLVIGHFGRVSDSDYSRFKSFEYFIQILRGEGHLLDAVHLVFAGKLTLAEEDLLRSLPCSKSILQMVDRQLAHELMRQCDILLLITGDRVSCATGKLFEYMASERYIICLSVVNNEAAKILEATGTGKTILVDDHNGTSVLLKEVTDLRQGRTKVPHDISAYSRKKQAATLSDWIQRACL